MVKIKIMEGISLLLGLLGTIFGYIHRNYMLLIGVCLLMLVSIYVKLQSMEATSSNSGLKKSAKNNKK